MKSSLHLLHLEDDPNDAAFVQSTLDADGLSWSRPVSLTTLPACRVGAGFIKSGMGKTPHSARVVSRPILMP